MNLGAFYVVIFALLVMLAAGYIARKTKIINESTSKAMSTIVIKVGQPFMIIGAMLSVEYTPERLKNGLITLGLGIVFHAIVAVIAYFAVFKFKSVDQRKISEFAIIFGNCGFVGFPLVESALGAQGLFYASFFMVSFNLFMWTWGIILLARQRNDIKVNPKTLILNFGTLPCLFGILLFVLQVQMPDFLTTAISYLGGLCTPLSMVITGSLIATVSLKDLFCDLKIYHVCLFRLIIAPIVITVLTWLFGFDTSYIFFMAIVFAMPTATSTVMFGELYEIEKKRAAVCAGMSSILSMATMPLFMSVLDKIF